MDSPNPALEQFLKSIPLFALVEPADMVDLLRLLRPVTLEAGQILFRQGDPGTAMWVLGRDVEISITATRSDGGRPVVVAYAKEGDTVGEMALVDDSARSGTAVVVQGGPAHQIDAIDFQAIRDARYPAAYKVLRRICLDLCRKLRVTNDRIVPPSLGVLVAPPLVASRRADEALIDAFPPFRPLPQVVKLALAQKLTAIELDAVQPIVGEGEPADAAYFIVRGEVTVGRNGRTLATLGPGSMFGAVSLIDHGRRSASVVSAGPATLLRLRGEDFDALFASGNRFAFELVDLVARQLVSHLRGANELLPRPGAAPRPTASAPAAVQATAGAMPELFGPLDLDLELGTPA
ncbi:MAG: cyclic nucleotide-binding domain-containing protein [Myxococcaceae bacterium]|nr:cyclic nucleotide-binding domain-containing protein [Myxococcaceae bacterium]